MSPAPAGAVTIRRKFPVGSWSRLWEWLNTPRYPNFDDYGPNRDLFKNQLGYRIDHECTWGIRIEGMLVGYLAFAPLSYATGQFHGLVIDPQYRRQGVGEKAVLAAMEDLKVVDGIEKYIVWTFADNPTIERLFRRLGFAQEGYITGATKREGQPLDMRILCYPGKEVSCHSAVC